MKKLITLIIALCMHTLLHAQCNCYLDVTTKKKNAIQNCSNGSITAFVNGDICGSLTLTTVSLISSATSGIIETQYLSSVPGYVYFENVPYGGYDVVASHPCSIADTSHRYIPNVVSNPSFIASKSDVSVFGCNDGAIGIEITDDYCPQTLNIMIEDSLYPGVPISYLQTPYCSHCFEAENLKQGVYKIDVFDSSNPVHHISYITIDEPVCQFYITANQGRLAACNNESLVVHLSGNYCLSNAISVRLYNSSMKLKDSIINQVLNDSLVHFYNVRPGTYTVIANYANSCTSSTTAVIKKYCPVPLNLADSYVGDQSQLLSWSGFSCLSGYEVSYKLAGNNLWQKITNNGANNTSLSISSLVPGATYYWRVRSICSPTSKSQNSAIKSFTVSNSNRLINSFAEQKIVVKPNPTTGIFTVVMKSSPGNATQKIYNAIGEQLFSRNQCMNEETYDLSNQPGGIYILIITNSEGTFTQKIEKY